jgi:hypothetical protein
MSEFVPKKSIFFHKILLLVTNKNTNISTK